MQFASIMDYVQALFSFSLRRVRHGHLGMLWSGKPDRRFWGLLLGRCRVTPLEWRVHDDERPTQQAPNPPGPVARFQQHAENDRAEQRRNEEAEQRLHVIP